MEVSKVYSDLTKTTDCKNILREITREHLINSLNFLNFQNNGIIVNLRHKDFDRTLTLHALPQPCADHRLDCIWQDKSELPTNLACFHIENLIIPKGCDTLLVVPTLIEWDNEGLTVILPEKCRLVGLRKIERHPCQGISATLIQNSALFEGKLIDFNANSFCVELSVQAPQTFQWMNTELPANILLRNGGDLVFAGECLILRETLGSLKRRVVLAPTCNQTQRFRPKQYRSSRIELIPTPHMVFTHPLTHKTLHCKVLDVSGSGLSVEDSGINPLLLPGIVIKHAEIRLANSFKLSFSGQVIHRKTEGLDQHSTARCGIVFLDMKIDQHIQLVSLIQKAKDPNSHICSDVDPDELWKFFFETGFIYPQKYLYLHENKETAKNIYRTLYTQSPNIARHFIYREQGDILGHVSTLRFYEKAWMIHHHAARGKGAKRAGIAVLNQIGCFINDSHRIHSIHMDYVFCYFRPDNSFPKRVFGGVAQKIDDHKGCSIDTFAYLHQASDYSQDWDLAGDWELTRASSEDLLDLAAFYENRSGGLLVNALDLDATDCQPSNLEEEYRKLGIRKERHIFTLKKQGVVKSVLILNSSDFSLNMSELTNCLKVFVFDENLRKQTLNCVISLICSKNNRDNVPVLIYPVSYADKQQIPYEKLYSLWILSMKHTDSYFDGLKKIIRHIQH